MEIVLELRPELVESIERMANSVFSPGASDSGALKVVNFRECYFTRRDHYPDLRLCMMPYSLEINEGKADGVALSNIVDMYDELQKKNALLDDTEKHVMRLKKKVKSMGKEIKGLKEALASYRESEEKR